MNKVLRIILSPTIGIIVGSFVFMKFMPFGTFDYKRIEFYLCILGAFTLEISLRYILKKYQKNFMSKLK